MARHEQAKGMIGNALSTLEGVQVRLEPLVLGTARRNDIRITGSRPASLSTQEFDLTIVSMASQQARAAVIDPRWQDRFCSFPSVCHRQQVPGLCGKG